MWPPPKCAGSERVRQAIVGAVSQFSCGGFGFVAAQRELLSMAASPLYVTPVLGLVMRGAGQVSGSAGAAMRVRRAPEKDR